MSNKMGEEIGHIFYENMGFVNKNVLFSLLATSPLTPLSPLLPLINEQ